MSNPTPETLTDAEVAVLPLDERIYFALCGSGMDEDEAQAALDIVMPLVAPVSTPETTPSPEAGLSEEIAEILGLETSPDGEPYYLLTRDQQGSVVEGVDYSGEVSALASLVATHAAPLLARAEAAEAGRDEARTSELTGYPHYGGGGCACGICSGCDA